MADRNGITLLEDDHQQLRKLLSQLEAAAGQKNGRVHDLCDQITLLLRAHTAIEEEIFYPAHREARGDQPGEVMYFEAMAEHRIAKMLMVELRETPTGTPQFEAGARLLRSLLEHHLEEEEDEMFPSARDHLSDEELQALGGKMAERREALMAAGDMEFKHPKPTSGKSRSGRGTQANGQRGARARDTSARA